MTFYLYTYTYSVYYKLSTTMQIFVVLIDEVKQKNINYLGYWLRHIYSKVIAKLISKEKYFLTGLSYFVFKIPRLL